MKDQLLHTPDGVRDIYNGECRRKLQLQERLHKCLLSYGYQDIQTPTFEFFNIFSHEIGTTPSKDLYKFFDKEGNTLVLRPDFTPSIARSAVKYFTDKDTPLKLCYMGNTFINSSDYQGRLKENTQCGAELIGDATIAADAEILSMVVDALKTGGLKDFQIAVGHARFFSGLIEAAQISEEGEQTLRELISNKNFFGVEEFIGSLTIDDKLKKLFKMLGSFSLDRKEIELAIELGREYPVILEAVKQLDELRNYISYYGIQDYVTFELGIVSNYHYYTGIIFSAYTFGTGEPIVKGGRYDRLLNYFGKNTPAIGFAIVVDQLMAAISRQGLEEEAPAEGTLIVFDADHAQEAVRKAISLRAGGEVVDMQMHLPQSVRRRQDYMDYALKKRMKKVEFIDGE